MYKLLKNLLLLSVFCAAANSMAAQDDDFYPSLGGEQDAELPSALQDILLNAIPDEETASDSVLPMEGLSITANDLDDTTLRAYSSKLTLNQLGMRTGITMSAGQKESGVNFTLPVDKMVISSRLELFIELSEEMAQRGSHLEVKVNGQSLGSLPLNRAELTDFELEVPSEYLSQDNNLTFSISDDEEFACMIDYSGKYKIKIDSESYLALDGYRIDIEPSLSLFPLPFFDSYEQGKPEISYVLPKELDPAVLKAATMLASYFGQIAEYRGIKFKVSSESLPKSHAIIFGHPGEKVAGIDLPEEPGVYIRQNPYYGLFKNLFIVAESEDDFLSAVEELCNQQNPNNLDYFPIVPRELYASEAYDAPNWLPTNRKVYLKDLLKGDQSLVTRGFWHSALNLSFRAAPDLYQLYEGQGDLFISYEFPLESSLEENTSGLNISLSGNYIDKLPVNKKGLIENLWRMSGGDSRESMRHIQIPPNMIYGDNNLELYFDLRMKKDTKCNIMQDNNNIKSVIDDTSYIDFTQSKHFAKLPNLSFFVGASFPFSRYADFSHSIVLLPEIPSKAELETLFLMAARAGNATGTMVYNENIYLGDSIMDRDPEVFLNKDILVVATLKNKNLLKRIFENSAFEMNGNELNIYDYGIFSTRGGILAGLERFLSGDFRSSNVDANRYVRTSLAWRGFLSMISPFDSNSIAVVVTATEDNELTRLSKDLDNYAVNRAIGGDISVISGDHRVESYTVGDHIFTGDVSTSFKILQFAGEHVFWLSVSSFIVMTLLSLIASVYLQKRAKRRLAEGYEDKKFRK